MLRRSFMQLLGLAPAAAAVGVQPGSGDAVPAPAARVVARHLIPDELPVTFNSDDYEDRDQFHLDRARERIAAWEVGDKLGIGTWSEPIYNPYDELDSFKSWSSAYKHLKRQALVRDRQRRQAHEYLERELKMALVPKHLRGYFR
jgi:hypothetical protein